MNSRVKPIDYGVRQKNITLAKDAMIRVKRHLEDLRAQGKGDDCIETSRAIGEAMMHARGAVDNSGPDNYDFLEDPDGYQVSILLGLMHWSRSTRGRRSFFEDLQRARGMFDDDIAAEPDDEDEGSATCANREGVGIL